MNPLFSLVKFRREPSLYHWNKKIKHHDLMLIFQHAMYANQYVDIYIFSNLNTQKLHKMINILYCLLHAIASQ